MGSRARLDLGSLQPLLQDDNVFFHMLRCVRLHSWFLLKQTCIRASLALRSEMIRNVIRSTPWPLSVMDMQEDLLEGSNDLNLLYVYLEQACVPRTHLLQLRDIARDRAWWAGVNFLEHRLKQTVQKDVLQEAAIRLAVDRRC